MAQARMHELLQKALAESKDINPSDPLFFHNGVMYPTIICCPGTLNILDTFEARSDDVILVGYPKTGTNWVGQILVELEAASGKYDEEEREKRSMRKRESELSLFPYLEFGDPAKLERIKQLPSRRVIKTHLAPQNLPKSIFQKKAKMLVLFRNPKDTAVSYLHFANGMKLFPTQKTWDEFFSDFNSGKVPWGLYFDHIIEWNKYLDDKNVMFITYEEIKENAALGMKRMADFFDFSVSEQEIQSIVEKTSFKSMKEEASKTHGEMGKSLFRKGIVGDWKNIFSEEQNEEMDKTFEENIARTKLGMMLKYDVYCTNWLDHILNFMENTAAKYTEEEMKKIMELEKELEVTPRLEFGNPDKFQRMKKLPSRRIIVTHLSPHALPSSIFKNKAKILVLIRNPKDTLVSYYHFINKIGIFPPSTWDDHFTSFMDGKVAWGSYFDYLAEWDKYIDEENITAISYEELKENLNVGLKKIAQFLGFSLNEEEIQSIVDKSTFAAMKQKGSETHGEFGDILFRKGSVGDWKSMLSESQNKEMDKRFEECLSRTKVGAKIKYDLYCKV
ncbi:sulfotransferase 6B1-like [Paroedura picta]|uniref:sulfotransferase 6B1-like n=1 Tax=Paroedura picta TaxID=143630 RepID=UPI004057B028